MKYEIDTYFSMIHSNKNDFIYKYFERRHFPRPPIHIEIVYRVLLN